MQGVEALTGREGPAGVSRVPGKVRACSYPRRLSPAPAEGRWQSS